MTATLIAHECRRRGVRFRTEGGRLRWRGPKGAVSPSLADAIAQHKRELIAFLEAESGALGPAEAGFSPHSPEFSPRLVRAKTVCGLGDSGKADDASYYVATLGEFVESKSVDLVHIGHIGQENIATCTEEARTHREASPEIDDVRGASDVVGGGCVCGECGLCGLDRRNPVDFDKLISSPHPEIARTRCGLDPAERGLNPGSDPLPGPIGRGIVWVDPDCYLEGESPPDRTPDGWRWTVANWPHARWIRWRWRSGELEPPGATAAQIAAADHEAYLEIQAEPAPTLPARPPIPEEVRGRLEASAWAQALQEMHRC